MVVDAGLTDLARRLPSSDNRPRDFVNEVATLVDKLRDTPRTASRARLVAALDALAVDDYGPVARFARYFRENRRDTLMGIATDCASGASEARYAAIRIDLATGVTGNAINYPFPEICETVPFGLVSADR